MVRIIGAVVIAIGFILFLGNFSGAVSTIPGLGIFTILLGGVVVALSDRFDTLPPGGEE